MSDITASRIICEPNCGIKKIIVRTGTTVTGATSTATLTLANFGCDRLLAVYGCVHTTEDSIMVQEGCTTSVSSGILTILTETGNDNKKRVYTIWAECAA